MINEFWKQEILDQVATHIDEYVTKRTGRKATDGEFANLCYNLSEMLHVKGQNISCNLPYEDFPTSSLTYRS